MLKIFDRKGDYSALSSFPGFVYWMLPDFAMNLLEPPPGVSFRSWIGILSEILSNYLDIRVAARGLFTTICLHLHEERQLQGIALCLTLEDVHARLESLRYPAISNLNRYRETLLNRIEALITDLHDQVCLNKKLDWQSFLSVDWALSLIGLPTDRQNLLITVIIAKILTYRMVHNLRSTAVVDLFVFDEAHTMFSTWYERREGTHLLLDYLRMSREYGAGFIVASQTTDMARTVLGNTATKVMVGGCGVGSDYDTFASATAMTLTQKEQLKQLTIPGQACGKDPRYPHPFRFEVPRIA
jgi:hypothetical protein